MIQVEILEKGESAKVLPGLFSTPYAQSYHHLSRTRRRKRLGGLGTSKWLGGWGLGGVWSEDKRHTRRGYRDATITENRPSAGKRGRLI